MESQARHHSPPNRVRLPADCQFASDCSPPRLAATQLSSATGPWLPLTRTSTVLFTRLHGRTIPACAGTTVVFLSLVMVRPAQGKLILLMNAHSWIEMGYAQEHYSQQQLDELDRLTEKWVEDYERSRR